MSQTTQRLREVAVAQPAEAQFHAPAVFDADAWHAMQARDDQLIHDSILHGAARSEYVYEFSISNTKVRGVSVVGARELASQYGGIKSRIVASVDKTGELFVFKSFEPLAIQANLIPQLAEQEDFYEVVVEIQDLKSGNSIQVRKKETKTEKKRNGETYDRPHYDVIAESKAFRNGVLSILPQGVIKKFMERCLQGGNTSNEKTIDQLREGALAFAAMKGITLDRRALEQLTYAQIFGLGNSTKDGIDAFKGAALSLGIVVGQDRAALPPADDGARKGVDPRKEQTQGAGGGAATTQGTDGASQQGQQQQTGSAGPTDREAFEEAMKLAKAGKYEDAQAVCPPSHSKELQETIDAELERRTAANRQDKGMPPRDATPTRSRGR